MNYIIVLNWNSERETIKCVESLRNLDNFSNCRVIVVDNNSHKKSYDSILEYFILNYENEFIEIGEKEAVSYNIDHNLYLIRNEGNYGYAGGNNIGIKFALKFESMSYVWILNNDTIVQTNSLKFMLHKFLENNNYGVVGSRLVELENKSNVQGVGGIINSWLCTTKEIGSDLNINDAIDEKKFEEKIDYVIGASLLISRDCLETVGLLCEDYFLYYEEIDYCNRAKSKGFLIGIASKSVVFHAHGASTNKGKSLIADYYSVRNRILITRKFYPNKLIFVKLSIFLVCFNRMKRFQFSRAFKYLKFMFI